MYLLFAVTKLYNNNSIVHVRVHVHVYVFDYVYMCSTLQLKGVTVLSDNLVGLCPNYAYHMYILLVLVSLQCASLHWKDTAILRWRYW